MHIGILWAANFLRILIMEAVGMHVRGYTGAGW